MALNFSLDSLMEQSLLSDDPWWRYILDGAGWTVGLAVSAFLLALVLGIIVGTLLGSRIECFYLSLFAAKSFFFHLYYHVKHLLIIMWHDFLELWKIFSEVIKYFLALLRISISNMFCYKLL